MKKVRKVLSCDTCAAREKSIMWHTSMCMNVDSEHYGAFIDEDHPDYAKNTNGCYVRKPLSKGG